MTVLKFRVWDFDKKQMIYYDTPSLVDGNLCFSSPKGKASPEDVMLHEDAMKQKDFVIMPYTGLLDKHGQECYEGDILFEAIEPDRKALTHQGEDSPVVTFDKGRFTDQHGEWDLYQFIEECEIIGNIFQRELLDEKS